MKISYITSYDSLDIRNWSGTGYMIAKSLENQENHLHYIRNLVSQPKIGMYAKKIFHKLRGEIFDIEREPAIAQQYARQIHSLIRPDTDILFSPGTIPISLVQTNRPKVLYTDATFAGMIGFYDYFSKLCPETVRHGNYLEQQALDSAQLAIFSSDWAAKTAIDYYNVAPSKVKIVPFGANLERTHDLISIKAMIARRSQKECHLLFPAVEWERKGGDMAIAIAACLNKSGLKTTLHIAGLKKIPLPNLPHFIKNHGFIDKRSSEGIAKIDSLFSNAHFLILPTKADCTPIVFSEANSFGVPCITTNVGGISTIIKNNINGISFSLSTPVDTYVNFILSAFADVEKYKHLALSSFNEYQTRLNWDATGKALTRLLREL